jgi:hypothetical protein
MCATRAATGADLNAGLTPFRCAISVPYHSIPYALTCFFSIPNQIAPVRA